VDRVYLAGWLPLWFLLVMVLIVMLAAGTVLIPRQAAVPPPEPSGDAGASGPSHRPS
jgi:hypothetical protein